VEQLAIVRELAGEQRPVSDRRLDRPVEAFRELRGSLGRTFHVPGLCGHAVSELAVGCAWRGHPTTTRAG